LSGLPFCLLCGDEEGDGVEIGQIKAGGAGEDDIFKYTDIEPGESVDAQMVKNGVFFWVEVI
jgi:hypothetical protein